MTTDQKPQMWEMEQNAVTRLSYPANEERIGQAWMNALREMRPDLYEKLMSHDSGRYDPFYNDRLIPAARTLVELWWG